jgi:hypothetical protein
MRTGPAAACPREIRGRDGGRYEDGPASWRQSALRGRRRRRAGLRRHQPVETQALRSTRPDGFVGIVGVPTVSSWPARSCSSPTCTARRARPVRRFLPELIDLVCNREIEPGKVFDLTLPLDQAAEAGLLRYGEAGHAELRPPPGSDGQRQLVECGGHPPVRRLLSGQLVVSASKVLDERMAGDDHPGTAIPLPPDWTGRAGGRPRWRGRCGRWPCSAWPRRPGWIA